MAEALSARAVLVRIAATTAAIAVVGVLGFAVSMVAITSTGDAVSTGVKKWETCAVMQARPCNRLSPAVLAADTGLQLPAGTKVLQGEAGRYFLREDRFSLTATVSVPAGKELRSVSGVILRDDGESADGRHSYHVSMRIS